MTNDELHLVQSHTNYLQQIKIRENLPNPFNPRAVSVN